MRTRKNSELAVRVLRRGDLIGVRFVTDVYPARVLRATRNVALARLLATKPDGAVDEHSHQGEALLTFRRNEQVELHGVVERGLWRQNPFADGLSGIVYNGAIFQRGGAL